MNEPSVMQQGLMLTLIGMSFVFLFLAGMIGAMHVLRQAVAWIDKRWPVAQPAAAGAATDNSAIAVAIAAAKKILNK